MVVQAWKNLYIEKKLLKFYYSNVTISAAEF